MTIHDLYQIYLEYPQVQTDTRKLKPGDIFFALSGPNFNGNHFALQALKAGASYAIIDEEIEQGNDKLILVENVLSTLQELAKYHRQHFTCPFLAITGSNGKTTTKELVYTVLAAHYKTYTTQGNLNNHIGIPLTLLSIKKDAEIAVIEMGANHQKEIEGYCKYVLPTHGIITNCGKAHLEGFGGIEGVRKGKGELFDFLCENNGTVFLNNDLDYLVGMAKNIPHIYSYGSENDAGIMGKAVSNETFLSVEITNQDDKNIINSQLVGDYNLPNVLCAVATGYYFKVPFDKIKKAIEEYAPSNSRSQMVEQGSNKIILDAYNANPSSMKLAIENMAGIKAENKILMLGGMMELGEESLKEHSNLVELMKKYKWDHVLLVGGDFKSVPHPYLYFDNSLEAANWYKNQVIKDSYILIKGSRSIQMEKILG